MMKEYKVLVEENGEKEFLLLRTLGELDLVYSSSEHSKYECLKCGSHNIEVVKVGSDDCLFCADCNNEDWDEFKGVF